MEGSLHNDRQGGAWPALNRCWCINILPSSFRLLVRVRGKGRRGTQHSHDRIAGIGLTAAVKSEKRAKFAHLCTSCWHALHNCALAVQCSLSGTWSACCSAAHGVCGRQGVLCILRGQTFLFPSTLTTTLRSDLGIAAAVMASHRAVNQLMRHTQGPVVGILTPDSSVQCAVHGAW